MVICGAGRFFKMRNIVRAALLVVLATLAERALAFSGSVTRRSGRGSVFMAAPLVTIGTRGSPLALAQAYETKRLLGVNFPELRAEGAVEIKKIMTKVRPTSQLLHASFSVAYPTNEFPPIHN